MNIVYGILTIYIWIIVAVLLYFIFLIARFYEQKSGQKTYYNAFWVAIGLFILSAGKYTLSSTIMSGDTWADISQFLAGLITGGFSLYLLKLMVGSRTR